VNAVVQEIDAYAHLPRAVREQAQRSDAALRQLRDAAEQSAQPANPSASAAAEIPNQDGAPLAAPGVMPQAANEGQWQHKFSVLQGKYDAEVPRLHGEVARLTNQVNFLDGENGTLRRRIQELEAGHVGGAGSDGGDDESLAGEYSHDGDDKLDSIRELYGDEMADVVGSLAAEVRTFKQERQQTAEQKFYAAIQQAVEPFKVQWETVNQDPGFVRWLQHVDPYTGSPLQALLNQSAAELNAHRAAAFFTDYLRSIASPASQPEPTQQPAAPAAKPSDRLAYLVQPDASGAGTAVSGEKKVWSRDEISQFYSDLSKGKYRGRDAESDQINQDIVQASREGRVR
jgi:hypothetical protein